MIWSLLINGPEGKTVVTISEIKNLGESGTFAISGGKLDITGQSIYGDLLENESACPNDWIWWCSVNGYSYRVLDGGSTPDEPELAAGRDY